MKKLTATLALAAAMMLTACPTPATEPLSAQPLLGSAPTVTATAAPIVAAPIPLKVRLTRQRREAHMAI